MLVAHIPSNRLWFLFADDEVRWRYGCNDLHIAQHGAIPGRDRLLAPLAPRQLDSAFASRRHGRLRRTRQARQAHLIRNLNLIPTLRCVSLERSFFWRRKTMDFAGHRPMCIAFTPSAFDSRTDSVTATPDHLSRWAKKRPFAQCWNRFANIFIHDRGAPNSRHALGAAHRLC
jgi:hypothetical protein